MTHLAAVGALDTRVVARLGAFLTQMSKFVTVAAGDGRRVTRLVALERVLVVLSSKVSIIHGLPTSLAI